MENLPSLLRPHALLCPSLPLAPPLNSRTQVTPVPRRSRHRGTRLSTSAVAAKTTLRTKESASSDAFDWLDQWYPLAPVCDLDPRAPHGKMVLGLNVVAWHDRIAGEWRVFDDVCPHRLAPLSEGRIDHKGRLQCAYHGWCYDGAGACKFIPQAPALGPPVHKNSKACVASYPCVVQNKILWFYPRTEAEYKDVLQRKRPPYIPEIDDPSYFTAFGVRDLHYGYDILLENIINPAHLPYAHKGLVPKSSVVDNDDPGRYERSINSFTVEYDQEGGKPIKMKIEEESVTGFLCAMQGGSTRFTAPCTYQGTSANKVAAAGKTKAWFIVVALCIPVAPGKSRIIYGFPCNSGSWVYKIMPRWFIHLNENSVLDSEHYLLHLEERKYGEKGLDNWRDACYVPTSSDRMVVAFRNWFRKYCKNRIGWATSQPSELSPVLPKDRLLERYWSHVIQCTSCSAALKAMKALEVALQVASVAVVGFLAVAKGTLVTSTVQRTLVVSAAVLCFASSRWLADFIEKNFYFQDYVHAEH
ncbi:hypothetical protein EJB05_37448, partial [Eragrostis curvula]